MNVRWEVKAVGEWPAAGAGKLGTWEAWRLSGLNAVPGSGGKRGWCRRYNSSTSLEATEKIQVAEHDRLCHSLNQQ